MSINILYRPDCVNWSEVAEALRVFGIEQYRLIDSNTLPESHPYAGFSSPTILVNEIAVLGGRIILEDESSVHTRYSRDDLQKVAARLNRALQIAA